MKKWIVSLIIFLGFIGFVHAKNELIDLNNGFPKSLLKLNSPFILFQLPDDKIYLVNIKHNHKGCLKIMNNVDYEWNIDKRKYIAPVENSDEGISENNVKKLKYVLLTDTPLDKKTDIVKVLDDKTKKGELYCEALRANFK